MFHLGAGVGWERGWHGHAGWGADSRSLRYSAPEQMLGPKVVLQPRHVIFLSYMYSIVSSVYALLMALSLDTLQ